MHGSSWTPAQVAALLDMPNTNLRSRVSTTDQDLSTQKTRFVRRAPTLLACEARTSGSSVQVPCNHSCETIAPVRLIGVHRRRNLNGDSLMRTVDRGRERPYFDVSHCSTIQSGGSAARPDATASGHG